MKEQNEKYIYQITNDPSFQYKRMGITPEFNRQLESLYYEIRGEKNKNIIEKLNQLIVKHPTIPILKNYLSIAYNLKGNYIKAIEVNNWILDEHPDYLFAKVNHANTCIELGEYEKVPLILGEAMELKDLYPDREVFHISEITCFLKVAIRYYVAVENLELAENRFNLMKKLAPNHHDTDEAETMMFGLRMKEASFRWAEDEKLRISPQKTKPNKSRSNSKNAPIFNHPEINNLYQYGLKIPRDLLREIIALPRLSLIEDLEKVLEDADLRFNWFNDMEYDEERHSFVLHAIFLLKEINAEESLPKILSVLESDDEFLEMWLGDHKTVTIWQCIYCLGINKTALLKQFLLKPGVNTYSKTAVSEALSQIALHNPERRKEILDIFSEVFKYFSEATIDDNIIDSDFLGLAISDTIDCNFTELLPVIKILYEKQYVSLGINGNFNAVEKHFSKHSGYDHKKNILSIFDLYDHVLNTWAGYNEYESPESYHSNTNVPAISEKINRNDPCPCGSGKKYKKCCGN